MNYKNKHFTIFEKKYENQLSDYGDEDVEENEHYIEKN